MAQTTVNIDTNIKEELKMLNEMIEKLELLEDKSKMLQFITIRRVCKTQKLQYKNGTRNL